VCEEEAQLRIVWVGVVMIGVKLAIWGIVAVFLADRLLRDVGKNLDDVFSQDTFNIVTAGFEAGLFLSDTVLTLVKGWTS